eukprot:gene11699-15663_t
MSSDELMIPNNVATNNEPTRLLYFEDTYLTTCTSILKSVGVDAKGKFIVFDQTIFYPKGGGQPSDTGKILFSNGFEILIGYVATLIVNGVEIVHHYFTSAYENSSNDTIQLELDQYINENIGLELTMLVDSDKRLVNAKAHTSGHLIDGIVQQLAPTLVGKIGCHDISLGCYVKFEGSVDSSVNLNGMKDDLNSRLIELINEQRTVTTIILDEAINEDSKNDHKKRLRIVTIEGYGGIPCGGTHVSNLSEIREIIVTKISFTKKENMTKIAYKFS